MWSWLAVRLSCRAARILPLARRLLMHALRLGHDAGGELVNAA